jgi:hypothetical protein
MSYASEQAVLNAQWNAAQEAQITEQARRAPSVLMQPRISLDGNQWCALYGENLQDGVAGFGDSPEKAMSDFDKNWLAALPVTHGVPDTCKDQT